MLYLGSRQALKTCYRKKKTHGSECKGYVRTKHGLSCYLKGCRRSHFQLLVCAGELVPSD